MMEPEEICVNCYAKVFPYERHCPFCGKIWWKYDNIRREIETSDRGDWKDIQADSCRERREEVEHCNVD